jgi:hypothetical protein
MLDEDLILKLEEAFSKSFYFQILIQRGFSRWF